MIICRTDTLRQLILVHQVLHALQLALAATEMDRPSTSVVLECRIVRANRRCNLEEEVVEGKSGEEADHAGASEQRDREVLWRQ
jgi:hypothetical protein